MQGHCLVLMAWEISSRSRRRCLINSCRLCHLSNLQWIGHSQVWDKNRGRDKRARLNVSVDLIPWRAENTSTGVSTKVILHKEYSVGITEGEGILAGHYHKLQSFPQSLVVPPKQAYFHGVIVSIPNSSACLVADRYLCTFGAFGVQFPYKWKCWVPCSLRISNGCWIQRLHFWCPVSFGSGEVSIRGVDGSWWLARQCKVRELETPIHILTLFKRDANVDTLTTYFE